MRVFVYFNLHRKCWSLKALEGPNRGRIIAHRYNLTLADCQFRVSEAGRQRVIREGRKNVHAGVVGRIVRRASSACKRAVSYNPYKGATFVDRETQAPVERASFAVFNDSRQVFVAHTA
jgi:hypothetical protein